MADAWLKFYFVVSFARKSILIREETVVPEENPRVRFKSILTETWQKEKRSFGTCRACKKKKKKCFRSLKSVTSSLCHRPHCESSLIPGSNPGRWSERDLDWEAQCPRTTRPSCVLLDEKGVNVLFY